MLTGWQIKFLDYNTILINALLCMVIDQEFKTSFHFVCHEAHCIEAFTKS